MGIVNVTPDSFSDGGKFLSPDAAVDHALKLANEGATILDIGGESTRPYSSPVSESEELKRVIPVIERLAPQLNKLDAYISIDTSKAAVARAAIDAGAEIINDVTGLDAQMIDVALDLEPGICAMHMQGTPQTMQDSPRYENVTAEILDYLKARRDYLLAAGINFERICLDPGIGFGKTHEHNLTLMNECGAFHQLSRPVLVGHSRKGFIGKLMVSADADRTYATIGATMVLAQRGIQIVRVHDVAATRDALILFEACGGIDGNVARIE
ncbi:MAG: dihydropteroate synthase [Planctomycetales bacterium]|nr:dihydropteroate synthase [Planctomycetales bacterium]